MDPSYLSPSPRQRAMLRDMGITHWVVRERLAVAQQTSATGASNSVSARAQPKSGSTVPASARAKLDQLQADLDGPTPSRRGKPGANAGSGSSPPAAGNARSPVATTVDMGSLPGALQCTWLGAHAYVGRHYTEPGIRRFLRDVIVATAGQSGNPAQLPFDAADLAQRVGLEQAKKGLQAFVAKRLGAIAAQALLLDEALVAELPGVEGEHFQISAAVRVPVVVVPELRHLQDDSAAKRDLWLRVLSLRHQ